LTNITTPYKTNGTHIMENLDMLLALELVLFAFFIANVSKLFIHLLIKENGID
jgi:hypothetical protein